MMGVLSRKVALVTGASKALEQVSRRGSLSRGPQSWAIMLPGKEGADRVVAEIASKGGKAIAAKADVAKTAEGKELF
jgi:3-oxoacyl-[acyl-carrier protein] reductase